MIKYEEMTNILKSYRPGTFVKVVWEKDIANANAKKQGISIIKRCEGVVRAGITYANISVVKDILNGKTEEELENKKHSWFTHCEDCKCLIQSKKDNDKKYIQLFFVKGKKIKSYVTVDGKKQSLSKLYEDGLITKSNLCNSNDEEMITMTLSLDNIVSFG